MNAAFLRRHLTTLILVLLAGVFAVVYFVGDRGNVTTDEAELRKKNLVPAWRPDDIRALTLTTHGKTAKLVLAPPNDAGQRLWEIEIDGGRFLASQQAVDQLLGTLEFATFERRVSKDAVSEAELGLASPVTAVSIEMGPSTYRVVVGGPAPTPKDARYCEAEGGVFVITAQLAAALDMRPEALRTRTFVPYVSTDLVKLQADGEGGARHFVRAAWSGSRGAGFRFDGSTPEGDVRANAEAVDRLLGALGAMQAETFLADEEADKALKKRVTLTLVPRDDKAPKAVIEVGGACPGKDDQVVAVRREPTRTSACVPQAVMEALTEPASRYVDLSIVGARPDEMSELTITEGARTIEIARAGTGWHMRKPTDRKVSPEAGNALAETLASLDAAKIVSGAPKDLGLDPPRATLRVESSSPGFSADGGSIDRTEVVEVGAAQGDVVHVRRQEDGAILELAADKVRTLAPSEVVLRDAGVLDLPRDQVRGLAVIAATPEGTRAQRLTKTSSGWSFTEPKIEGLSADSGLVEDVTSALVGLRAVRWVAEKDDGSFGLAKPRYVIEVKVAESDSAPVKTVRVELGAATNDGVFARTGDDPAVFVAPPALEQAASLWLFDRQALVLDAAAIDRVEAVAGAKKLVAERAGDVWKSASGDGEGVAATLRSTVTGLIAEGVVSTGAPDKSFGLDKPRLTLAITAEPEQGAPKGAAKRAIRIAFGAGDSFRGTSVVYARREGIDATFAIAQGKVRALLDAAGVK
jgi:hypothetical protein